jgi:hypothetical protein
MLLIEDVKTVDVAIELLSQMSGQDKRSSSEILSK